MFAASLSHFAVQSYKPFVVGVIAWMIMSSPHFSAIRLLLLQHTCYFCIPSTLRYATVMFLTGHLQTGQTASLDVGLVQAIKALQLALTPTLQVQCMNIPFIRDSLTVEGVNALMKFRRGIYRMPENYFHLIQPLTSDDLPGDSSFVAHQLRVNEWKLTTACDMRTTLRD